LKITPLHSIFVITNFVITKRDKKTNKKLEINMHHLRGNAIPVGYVQNPYCVVKGLDGPSS